MPDLPRTPSGLLRPPASLPSDGIARPARVCPRCGPGALRPRHGVAAWAVLPPGPRQRRSMSNASAGLGAQQRGSSGQPAPRLRALCKRCFRRWCALLPRLLPHAQSTSVRLARTGVLSARRVTAGLNEVTVLKNKVPFGEVALGRTRNRDIPIKMVLASHWRVLRCVQICFQLLAGRCWRHGCRNTRL